MGRIEDILELSIALSLCSSFVRHALYILAVRNAAVATWIRSKAPFVHRVTTSRMSGSSSVSGRPYLFGGRLWPGGLTVGFLRRDKLLNLYVFHSSLEHFLTLK